jgi:hypothetical protein
MFRKNKEPECERCGACCVFYRVPNNSPAGTLADESPGVLSGAGKPCPQLEYNPTTGIAGCKVHEGDRPPRCEGYFCSKSEDFCKLNEIAKRMPEIMEQGHM